MYFYIELFRRLSWLFLAMTIIQGINIIINFKGDGLNNYEASFSTYLIKSTLGTCIITKAIIQALLELGLLTTTISWWLCCQRSTFWPCLSSCSYGGLIYAGQSTNKKRTILTSNQRNFALSLKASMNERRIKKT